ncbi:hypothetical protein CLV98_101680 [Dyadobacter jejuensis]|uniref:Uncharacterized protein n=2 Tax=Dyadobacter jejuensis TaxID=1082580 RepID=A0A316AT22_9BACT|nr:hypothetical protein CLV98_101680 [Dyadobacter jejuensis]
MLLKAWVIPLIYLDYEIRKDFIASTLCINRDKPMVICNGKCYLAEKVAEAERQKQQQSEQDYMSSLIYQVMDTMTVYSFPPAPISEEEVSSLSYFYKSAFLGRLVPDRIFHPPLA